MGGRPKGDFSAKATHHSMLTSVLGRFFLLINTTVFLVAIEIVNKQSSGSLLINYQYNAICQRNKTSNSGLQVHYLQEQAAYSAT